MLKVGLTGGIGCGKTTALKLFQQYGTPVIDADSIARELVEPGQPALTAIAEQLGSQFIKADGALDRALLKQKVFTTPHMLAQLESILHPAIRRAILDRMNQYAAQDVAYIIVDVPLLVEKGYQQLFDRIVVVDCTEEQQRQRVSRRDHLDNQQICAIMQKQASRKERLEIATETLDNTASVKTLALQVEALHRNFSRWFA